MTDHASLPPGFAHLEPFVERWGLPTMARRHARRTSSTQEERQAFYDAMSPDFTKVIDYLDSFPLDEMPPEAQRLMELSLALVEVAMSIEAYGPRFEADHAESSRLVRVVEELDGR